MLLAMQTSVLKSWTDHDYYYPIQGHTTINFLGGFVGLSLCDFVV